LAYMCSRSTLKLCHPPRPPCLRRKQSIEIIVALKKLGETLNAQEKAFLKQHDDALAMFESADQAIDASVVAGAVSGAAAE